MIRKLGFTVLLSTGVIACGGNGSDGGTGGGAAGGGAGAAGNGTGAAGGGGAGGAVDGDSPTVVSCTITQSSSAKTCIETSGALTAAAVDYLRMGCAGPVSDAPMAAQQQFALGPCPHAQALGACSTPSGNGASTTRWWYEDGATTANDVRTACEALGDTFVAP